METLLLAAALCGQPATCEVPEVCKPTVVYIETGRRYGRRPMMRILRAAGKAAKAVRPFRRGRCRR